jgi:hypothetical protein
VAALTSKPKASAVTPRPNATPSAIDSQALDECAEKNFVMRALCTRRACEQPQLHMHARCVALRDEDEARAQAQLSR